MQKINYVHGIDPKDLNVRLPHCKHGTPLTQDGLNVCVLCRHKQTTFTMRFPFEKWDAIQGKFVIVSQEEEAQDDVNDLDLFDHSEYGEPGPGTAAHLATMSNFDRYIAEQCVPGNDRINRINLSGIEDRRPHYDRLDSLAYSLGMVDDAKRIDPLAGVILDCFRALELDEPARKRLTLEIRKDRTKAQLVIDSAAEVSKEILPPIPLWTTDDDGADFVQEPEEIEPTAQAEMYATPIGDYNLMPLDYLSSRSRSAAFRQMKDRIALAVQGDDGKALAQIGKDLYSLAIDSQEKSTLFHLFNVAKNKVEYHLEHRFNAMIRRIQNHPQPQKLGKPLFELAKHNGPAMHRTGKEGRPKFTSAQWAKIWEAYRIRVPKAPPTEQIPLFEPPAF
jgi:hypothetical protein